MFAIKEVPFVVLICYVSLMALRLEAATLNDSRTLNENLLSSYNKFVVPIANQSEQLTINVTLYIMAIQEFDEVNERLAVLGIFGMQWKDANMKWNPADYNGASTVRASYKNVWVPEFILINPSYDIDTMGDKWQKVQFWADGTAIWYPGASLKTTCSVNVKYYPFDTQSCDLTFIPWGFSSAELVIKPSVDYIDTSFFSPNGAWDLVENSIRVYEEAGSPQINFNIKLKRKPGFIIVNILSPIMFLSMLNILVFLLPVESGERVSFCITVLLSIAVFMTIISDTLPKSSEPMSIISYILMMEMILSSLITLVIIINLRLYNMDRDGQREVPHWLRRCVNWACCRENAVAPHCTTNLIDADAHHRHTTVTTIMGSIDKYDKEKMKSAKDVVIDEDEEPTERPVTWRDVSVFSDWVALYVFTAVSILTFLVFVIVVVTN